MKIWGLTGGIASGKSTVAEAFKNLGVPVVSADDVYHQLLQPINHAPSPLAQAIGAVFPNVLKRDGYIDRQALGEQVFTHSNVRMQLEAITHPVIAEATQACFQDLADNQKLWALYDVPLLFEKNLYTFAGVIVVWVPEAIQLQRLIARDALTLAAAKQRLAAQMPLDEKKIRADVVIDNSGHIEQTLLAVQQCWSNIEASLC